MLQTKALEPTVSSPSASRPSNAYNYYVVIVLTLVYLCSSLDRMIVSTVAEPLKHEFSLSDTQLGVLTGLFFAISFAVCGVPLGMLADRVHRPRLLSGLLAVWSCLTFMSSFAQSYAMLALARIGVGASESGAASTSMSIISDLFPPEKRGLALSFFYVSTPIGISIGLALGGYLAGHFGWRSVFMVAGIPGMLLALLLLFTVRNPPRGQYDSGAEKQKHAGEHVTIGAGFRVLWKMPALLMIMAAGVCLIVAQAGTHAFLTPFLMRVHHISIAEAGFATGTAQFIPGIAGVLLGGILADRMARRSSYAGLFALAGLMLVTGPSSMAAFLVSDWHHAMILLAVHNFLLALYYGTHFSSLLSLTPFRFRGTIGGIHAVALTLMGYGVGPVLAGAASDFFQIIGIDEPIRWAEVAVSVMFLLSAVFYLAAATLVRRGKSAGQGRILS